jgi:hypothetical protein
MNRGEDAPLFAFTKGMRSDAFGLELRSYPTVSDRNELMADFIDQGEAFAHSKMHPRVLVGSKPDQNVVDLSTLRRARILN